MSNNQTLIAQCEEKARQWLPPAFDEETRSTVETMINNDDKVDLVKSFYKDLEFGTDGLCGIIGAGSSRMNIYTVGMATQGFANYLRINFKDKGQISVVVCHDCRSNLRLSAETVTNIFSVNGVKAYLFDDLHPIPECSFVIRHLKAQAGVNITASHDPCEYNGYGAYWDDDAQVPVPHDEGIIDEVSKVKVEDVRFEGNKVLIQIIDEDANRIYPEQVKTISIDLQVIKNQHNLKIVYTPLHGTGRVAIPRALASRGSDGVHYVKEQMVKDGNFPAVDRPNPKIVETLTLGLHDVKAFDADVLMASDPDADRVGMACKNSDGEQVLINGNQTCLFFLQYIIASHQAMDKMKSTNFTVKTIVTTGVIRKIVEKQNIEIRDCYTGSKRIAREIILSEDRQRYIGGGEESYGLSVEDFVRDKDAISTCTLLAEICICARDHGKTLYNILMSIYMEYGYSHEYTINVERPDRSGAGGVQQMMKNFRSSPPKGPGGSVINVYEDFQSLEITKAGGFRGKMDTPDTSNALQWFCTDGTKVSVRPSDIEPKIKLYLEMKDIMNSASDSLACEQRTVVKIEAIKKSLGL